MRNLFPFACKDANGVPFLNVYPMNIDGLVVFQVLQNGQPIENYVIKSSPRLLNDLAMIYDRSVQYPKIDLQETEVAITLENEYTVYPGLIRFEV
jgi:hypothetical protein